MRHIEDRIEEFRAGNVTVVAVLSDSVERASLWQRRYGLSFPLLADPGGETDTAFDEFAPVEPSTDQPKRSSPVCRRARPSGSRTQGELAARSLAVSTSGGSAGS